jgi:hypothetical protein
MNLSLECFIISLLYWFTLFKQKHYKLKKQNELQFLQNIVHISHIHLYYLPKIHYLLKESYANQYFKF